MHPESAPYFSPDLIDERGRLRRLHFGGASTPKAPEQAPPAVRETSKDVAVAGTEEKKASKARKGYAMTLLDNSSQPGSKTLLG